MFEFAMFTDSMIVGAFVVLLVFASLRFIDPFVDFLVSYRSSPVQAVEDSIPNRE